VPNRFTFCAQAPYGFWFGATSNAVRQKNGRQKKSLIIEFDLIFLPDNFLPYCVYPKCGRLTLQVLMLSVLSSGDHKEVHRAVGELAAQNK
jgi:hypothetical protein